MIKLQYLVDLVQTKEFYISIDEVVCGRPLRDLFRIISSVSSSNEQLYSADNPCYFINYREDYELYFPPND